MPSEAGGERDQLSNEGERAVVACHDVYFFVSQSTMSEISYADFDFRLTPMARDGFKVNPSA